jgi:hypothetical protein
MSAHDASAFTGLLSDYCQSLEIDGSAISAEGGLFDVDGVGVAVTHDEQFDRLCLAASVDHFAPERLRRLAPSLLQLNAASRLSGGQAFSSDMASGDVRLQQSLPLQRLTPEQFGVELAVMAGKCRAARELLARLEQLAETAGAAGASNGVESEEPGSEEMAAAFLTFRP